MAIEIRHRGDVAIVTPKGTFSGDKETAELQSRIQALADEGNRKLVVDLGNWTRMGDAPSGILMGAAVDYGSRQGRMKRCRVGKRDRGFFSMIRLERFVDMYETEDEAVASFEKISPPGAGPARWGPGAGEPARQAGVQVGLVI
jgi:anti-sigma B factor antagonist